MRFLHRDASQGSIPSTNSTPHSRAEKPLAVISGKGIHVYMDDLAKLGTVRKMGIGQMGSLLGSDSIGNRHCERMMPSGYVIGQDRAAGGRER